MKIYSKVCTCTCGQTGNVRELFTVNAPYKVPATNAEQGLRFSCLDPYLPAPEGRYYMCGRDSVVGTATRYELVSPGIKTRQRRDFPYSSSLAPRSTRPPIQCVPGFSRGKTAVEWCWLPTSLVPVGKAVAAIPASPLGACISILLGDICLY
jgi:hypothetical protein